MDSQLLLLKGQDFASWQALHRNGLVPDTLPYGLSHLQSLGWSLSYSDLIHRAPWSGRALRALRSRLEGSAGRMLGYPSGISLVEAPLVHRRARSATAVLAVFEDHAFAFALLRRLHAAPSAAPLVAISCWAADRVPRLDARRRRWIEAAIRACDEWIVFSSNQVQLFVEHFGVPADRITMVHYGADTEFYRPKTAAGGRFILSVGKSGRDYATFLAAIEQSGLPAKIACPAECLNGLRIPSNCEVLGSVSNVAYRSLMAEASMVVIATTVPSYPAGQSVLVEAMAMAKCVVISESPAIRDYVSNGVDGFMVPPADVAALRDQVVELFSDARRREAVGGNALRAAQERFNSRAMMRSIDAVLRKAVARTRL
jgi:glycosyltransferase involved in cell wall biosynthesis